MQFYYADGDQQKGPIDLDGLRSAGIKTDTLVWRDGMGEWQPAGKVPELSSLFPAIGAVPAQVSSGYPSPVAQPSLSQQFAPTPGITPIATGYTPHPTVPQQNLSYGGYGNIGGGAYGAPYAAPPSQGMSIASLVLGILAIPSIFCYGAGFLFALLAIIFGHIGHSQYKRQAGRASGMAIAGLVCGYLSLAIVALMFLFFFIMVRSLSGGGRGGW